MNMNKALQHLYKAVSGEDTTKVNISKLLVDIHYAMTGVECAVKNNWAKIIDSIATNWTGGGGSSDLDTATVSITNNTANSYELYDSACIVTIGGHETLHTQGFSVEANQSVSAKVVLFKGTAYINSYDMNTIATTGDITYEIDSKTGDVYFIITGDCTITIS